MHTPIPASSANSNMASRLLRQRNAVSTSGKHDVAIEVLHIGFVLHPNE